MKIPKNVVAFKRGTENEQYVNFYNYSQYYFIIKTNVVVNTQVNKFSLPSTSVSTNPGSGLTITARGTQIKINGKFKIQKVIKFSGKFDLWIRFNFVTLSFAMGADPSGHPTIWSTACQSQVSMSVCVLQWRVFY